MNNNLDYLKFFAGCLFGIYAQIFQPRYYELMIIIAGLIILSSGVTIYFGKNGKEKTAIVEKRMKSKI